MLIVRADATVDPEKNIVVRLFKRFVPMTHDFRGDRFTVVENGKRLATPLLLVLVLVEIADVVFAVDSIPAIFAVTKDPFLVYTSNVFAILGLRSLYFALAGIMHRFVYLKTGLALVLTFVGIKMILGHTPWKIDTLVALGVVASILTGAVVLSLWKTKSHAVNVAVPPRPVEGT
jgi:tellurite resistance protein TerC